MPKRNLCRSYSALIIERETRLILTQPTADSKAPYTTAPNDKPMVKPQLTRPTNRPRDFFPISSRTRMTDRVIMPAPAMPVRTLPRMKMLKDLAMAVTMPPAAKKKAMGRDRLRGEKMVARRPTSGERAEVAMRYVVLNHIAFSYSFRSSAIALCAIVTPDMLDAVTRIRYK